MIDIGIEAQKFMLVFFRIVSVLWLIPLLSSRFVSAIFKAGLSLLIAFLLYSSVNITVSSMSSATPFLLLLLTLREVFIGVTIGFIAKIIFSSYRWQAISCLFRPVSLLPGLWTPLP